MLKSVLCKEIGSPADFSAVAGAVQLDPVYNSTRKVVEAKTSGAACIGCHSQFNHYGFILEAYDGLGRHRTSENVWLGTTIFNYRVGCNPSDTSVVGYNVPTHDKYCPPVLPPYNHALDLNVSAVFDADRAPASVATTAEFAQVMADSNTVSSCMSLNLFRYMNLRPESSENNCELKSTQAKAMDSTQSLKAVMFDKFKEPWFRSRKVVQ